MQLGDALSQQGVDRLSRRATLEEERARDADAEVDRLRADNDRVRRANLLLEDRAEEVETTLQRALRERSDAEQEAAYLRDDASRLADEARQERARAAEAAAASERAGAERATRGSELESALLDNEDLRNELRARAQEVEVRCGGPEGGSTACRRASALC